MKKIIIIGVAILVALLLALSALGMSGPGNDFQAIKKAVKENPNLVPGQEAKWFKILVTDAKTGKDKVRVTLPLSVIEIVSKCVDQETLKYHGNGCNIDLAALFKELKAAGPLMFVEITEENETVKIWLE